MHKCIRVSVGCTEKHHPGDRRLACLGQWNSNMFSFFWYMTCENTPQEGNRDSFKTSFKNKNKQPSNIQCINKKISLAGSDQPGRVTITGDRETKHLLLNTSRLQSDMFAVLSSSDVWPKVIHIKHLACVLSPSPARALFSIILSPNWAAQADTLFSLTPSFHSLLSMSCFSFCCSLSLPLHLRFISASLSHCHFNPLFHFLYVLAFLDLRAWRWLDLIPHAGWSSPDFPRQRDS